MSLQHTPSRVTLTIPIARYWSLTLERDQDAIFPTASDTLKVLDEFMEIRKQFHEKYKGDIDGSTPTVTKQPATNPKTATTPYGSKCNRCGAAIKWPHDFAHRQPGDKPLNPADGSPHVCQDKSLMPR